MEEVLDTMPRARKISKLAEEEKSPTNNNSNTNNSNNHKSIAFINKKAKRLVQQAQRRGITLQVMPPVLERHKKNSSWYCGPRDLITWKVEVVLVPTRKTFSFNLSEQEEGIFDRILKHIAEFHKDDSDMPTSLPSDNYQLLIKRLPGSANNPRYIQIKDNQCLRKVLEGLTIVEHPTIHFVPNENMKDFPIGTNEITEKTATNPMIQDSTNHGTSA